MCIRTHAHKHSSTRIHTQIHTQKHTHTRTQIHTHTQLFTHTHTHPRTHTKQKHKYICSCKGYQIHIHTGLNVLAKNRRNWQVNFIDSGLEVAKTRFQTFLRGKSVLFKWKCQIREFHAHAMERGEVLKRYCGWQKEATLLQQIPKDRIFIYAADALQ